MTERDDLKTGYLSVTQVVYHDDKRAVSSLFILTRNDYIYKDDGSIYLTAFKYVL